MGYVFDEWAWDEELISHQFWCERRLGLVLEDRAYVFYGGKGVFGLEVSEVEVELKKMEGSRSGSS